MKNYILSVILFFTCFILFYFCLYEGKRDVPQKCEIIFKSNIKSNSKVDLIIPFIGFIPFLNVFMSILLLWLVMAKVDKIENFFK